MVLVLFLRGVNVGGQKRFKPSALARELSDYGFANVGAAGTFVVRKETDLESLRHEVLVRLPFEAELMICTAEEVVAVAQSDPFADMQERDVKHFVSILSDRPQTLPRLPIDSPVGSEWEVRVTQVAGRFAFSIWRRRGRGMVYPNEVVERNLGVTATTRGWNTIVRICTLLERT